MVNKSEKTKQSQQGMVSIIVTMIMMVVITLIIIGFSQIARREQRQALDRQLSTQAFYAAESGINDANETIKTLLDAGKPIPAKTACGPDASYTDATPYTSSNIIDSTLFGGSARLQYTCLLIDPVQTVLQIPPTQNSSEVIPLIASGAGTIDTIKFSWANNSNDSTLTCPTTTGTFLASGDWTCSMAVLRVDIVPNSAFNGNRGTLQSGTTTVFLYPQSSGGVATSTISNGKIIPVNCSNVTLPPTCSVSLTVTAQPKFYLRVLKLYRNNKVSVSATSAGSVVSLINAQATIDVTGKSNDVLRRVQIYKDISGLNSSSPTAPYPDFAIQSFETLCKQYIVYSGSATSDDGDIAGPCRVPNSVDPP